MSNYSGTPQVGQNPYVLPNLPIPVAVGKVYVNQSASTFLANNPRVAATCTGTLTTNPTTGDVLTLTVTNGVLPGGSLSVSYTASSDTVITAAAELAAALTSDATARQYDIFGTTAGTDTFTVNQMGPVGNSSVLTFSSTGSTTCSFTNSGDLTGGSGPVIPLAAFSMSFGTNFVNFRPGIPVSFQAVSQLVAAGQPVK